MLKLVKGHVDLGQVYICGTAPEGPLLAGLIMKSLYSPGVNQLLASGTSLALYRE